MSKDVQAMRLRPRGDVWLAVAVGALLATAFLHLAPEALQASGAPHRTFAAILFGLVLFFLLDKALAWHHARRHAALAKVSVAGLCCGIAGVAFVGLADAVQPIVPYLLALAASSLIYVALADLLPQLQRCFEPARGAAHVTWLLAGVTLVEALGHAISPR